MSEVLCRMVSSIIQYGPGRIRAKDKIIRAGKNTGDTVETDENSLNIAIKEPLGVCGLIIPVR